MRAFFKEEDEQGSFFKTLWFSSPPGAEPKKYTHPPFGGGGYSDAVLHFSPDASSFRARQLRDEPQSGRYPTRGYQQRQPSLERGAAVLCPSVFRS